MLSGGGGLDLVLSPGQAWAQQASALLPPAPMACLCLRGVRWGSLGFSACSGRIAGEAHTLWPPGGITNFITKQTKVSKVTLAWPYPSFHLS